MVVSCFRLDVRSSASNAAATVLNGSPVDDGMRLGGYLLSVGGERAWAQAVKRVWVHTCSLDGPHALANYQARGFRVYDQKTGWEDLPEASPGPWPGARQV